MAERANHGDALVARLRAAGCVFAEDEAAVLTAEAGSAAELDAMVARRVAGEPLEYVVGWTEFCGLRINVAPGVFVPRRRTGALVREAARLLDGDLGEGSPRRPRPFATGAGPIVLDLCCGTGAIAAALASRVPGIRLLAADVDPSALECAERNLAGTGARAFAGDLFDALPRDLVGEITVIVANAPYVPTESIGLMPPEARDHEHRVALDGGPDGTDVHRRIAAAAPTWLAPGGHLVLETGRAQAATTARHMIAAGLAVSVVEDDELESTVVVGRKSASSAPTGGP